MRCPECHSTKSFSLILTSGDEVYASRHTDIGRYMDDCESCRCNACGHSTKLEFFEDSDSEINTDATADTYMTHAFKQSTDEHQPDEANDYDCVPMSFGHEFYCKHCKRHFDSTDLIEAYDDDYEDTPDCPYCNSSSVIYCDDCDDDEPLDDDSAGEEYEFDYEDY